MEFKGLRRKDFAKNWDDAMPLGNGTTGALVFGNPINEIILTNHEDCYLPTPDNNECRPFNGAGRLEKTRELIKAGKSKEATEYYIEGLVEDGSPDGGMIWPNPFETLSEFHLDLEGGEIKDYDNVLDFKTGENRVSFAKDAVGFVRRTFVSRSRNVIVIKLEASDKQAFSMDFSVKENDEAHFIEKPVHQTDGEFLISEVTHSEEESGYITVSRIVKEGGEMSEYTSGSGFYLSKVRSVMILISVSSFEGKKKEAVKHQILRSLKDITADYDELLKEHVAIHKELFMRVTVSLSDNEEMLTNDEVRALCSEDYLAPEFLERMTDMGRYLEISSFGHLPPNLQGLWNGLVSPPWSSDYTLDENIQMMMWQCMPGGFSEFTRNYFDWLESYTEDFKANAEAYYGCEGIMSAPRVSSNGMLRHFSPMWPMCFWISGAGWLSSVYQEYYEYTLDTNILLRGVKYWKEVVKFYEGFMTEDENGRYVFSPSYSPENTPVGFDSPTTYNCTMDVTIAKEVYTNLINACLELGIEEENVEKWQLELSKLPDYAVNEDGALKEWIPKEYKDDYHHRHSSHLYMVFPGHEALSKGNDELLKACHKAAELRLIDGVDAISGWGLAHLSNISARLKDDNLWYMSLNRLIQKFTLNNLFTGHNEHSLFQMDANLGITASVYEMFAYSDNEKIELFPVVCDKIQYACVKGLRARNHVHIDLLEKEGEWVRATLQNLGNRDVRIICPRGYSLDNGDREITLHKGETLNINGYRRE